MLPDLERDDPKFAFPAAQLVGLYRCLWESCVSKHIDGQKLERENLVLKEAGAHQRKVRDGFQLRHDKQLSRLRYVGALPKERLGRAFVFLNKSNKAMPYLNRPYKTHNRILAYIGNRYIDPPEDAASDRVFDTCTWPKSIDDMGRVHFQPNHERKDWQRLKNRNIQSNCVVYCSGYISLDLL